MKKQVADYIRKCGGKAAYSGNTRTMWVTAPTDSILKSTFETGMVNLLYMFPNMTFDVKMNE